ncbi:DNA ligase [Marinobacterium litorale]|uniref:DNA ligase n=1 Tax=Marinobacterium litorale TaxID=404770 RepID=UPI00041AB82F|nr:DNA ligase [Marinobacterium litorale]
MHPSICMPAAIAVGLTLPTCVAAAPAPQLMSAESLSSANNLDLPAYLVSEKLDGVRARWTGSRLITRSGYTIHAPKALTASLPPIPLDGELWLGRGRFHEVSALVRAHRPESPLWKEVSLQLFDLPAHPGGFAERDQALQKLTRAVDNPQIQAVEQRTINSRKELSRVLTDIHKQGGEGLMLHHRTARYIHTRSHALLKYKGYEDAEARVIGYTPGQGKYNGMTGALIVETEAGMQFRLGSGLSDAERADPPSLGAWVTYRYNGFTAHGKPRFARFIRIYDPQL